MKSILWLCLIYSEIALAIFLAAGIAQSYGRASAVSQTVHQSRLCPHTEHPITNRKPLGPGAPSTCPGSRSVRTPNTSQGYSVTPMPRTSTPRTTLPNSTVSEGFATWYPPTGNLTASGRQYDPKAMTCAMWITNSLGRPLYPDGRLVKVINVETSRTVVVAWTDNGPGSVPRSRGVIIDLTPAAFTAIGAKLEEGRVKVRIERVDKCNQTYSPRP